MSLSQTVAELGLIIKGVLYLFLRPFGASSIQGSLIIAEIRYLYGLVHTLSKRSEYSNSSHSLCNADSGSLSVTKEKSHIYKLHF